jgi:hypothetical protein
MNPVGLDASYADHPKVVGLSDHAVAMETRAFCYAVRNGTDGFIPDGCLWRLAKDAPASTVAGELVTAGRWERDDERGGYWVHGYDEHNELVDEQLARRAAGAKRMQRSRARARARPAASPPDAPAARDAPPTDSPTQDGRAEPERPGALLRSVPPARPGDAEPSTRSH